MTKAAHALAAILDDPETPASARVAAARAILEHGDRLRPTGDEPEPLLSPAERAKQLADHLEAYQRAHAKSCSG